VKRFGDRKDGKLIRHIEATNFIMPHIFPNRCDNEAYISERIDLEGINKYIAKKNAEGNDDFPYTMFHIIVAALIKTLTLRPKMNRFIANKNYYQRNDVSAAFVVKKQFSDDGGEGLVFFHAKDSDNLETVHNFIKKKVRASRNNEGGSTEDSMEILNKMPRFLSRFLIWIITKLDKHGWCPNFLIEADPYYSSILLSNIGSIKMKCGYHHLANWGTNSVFCIIGEKKKTAVFDADGNFEMRETVDLGLTIDERLADGYYYSKSIRLLKKLLENPELLELPMNEEVEY